MEQMMIHKTVMMKKCQIWSKEYCRRLDFEKENYFFTRFHNWENSWVIALKADAVFASFNPFFNLFFPPFLKASLRVDNIPLYGANLSQLRHYPYAWTFPRLPWSCWGPRQLITAVVISKNISPVPLLYNIITDTIGSSQLRER